MFTLKQPLNLISAILIFLLNILIVIQFTVEYRQNGLVQFAYVLLFFVIIPVLNSISSKIKNPKIATESTRFIFLLFSPILYFMLFESLANLFFIIILTLLLYLWKKFEFSKINIYFFLLPLIFSSIISNFEILIIPVIVTSLFIFRQDFRRLSIIWIILLFGIIYFDFFSSEQHIVSKFYDFNFYKMNIVYVIISVISAVIAGWLAQSMEEAFYSSGLILFFITSVFITNTFITEGFYTSIKMRLIDFKVIFYSFPFLISALHFYEVDRFLGKKLG